MRWLKRIFLTLIAIITVAAGAAGIYVWRSLPASSAQYTVAAPLGETTVAIDANGIPAIDAKSERDLAFTVGFMHARDRLWQLEMHRRIARGELAEILGPKALGTDKFLRTLGVHRAARAQLERMPLEARAMLQAYADGVNSYVLETMKVRPPEFVILGVQPGTWEPVDTVAWAVMMAYDLSGNWGNELLRLQLAARLPVSRIDELLPPQPGDKLPPHGDYATLYKSLDALKPSTVATATADNLLFVSQGIEGIGSNNWVVNGSRTVSGKPLLANDPHLALAAPAIWYFTHQKAPGIDVMGATLPGGPSVILGRTKGVAWGFTNTGPDVQDLYLEEINGQGEARAPDGWAKLATRVEIFKVKGEADVQITVRESRHGPIISDAHAPSANAINTKKFAIAMRWTALDIDNQSVLVAPLMNKAQTVAELKQAMRNYSAPQQNVVMADTLGHTAFIAPGRVPIRKPANDINGLAPAPGWDTKYDWAGFLTFDQMPQHTVDTFLATANQRIHGNDYPHFISGEWAHSGRKLRIEELLASKPKHDAQSLREIQHDLKHTHDLPLLEWLAQFSTSEEPWGTAVEELRKFKRSPFANANSAGAMLFWAWTKQVAVDIFEDDVGSERFASIFGRRDFRAALNRVLTTKDDSWCDDSRTPKRESCDEIARGALSKVTDRLIAVYGSDFSKWRWDNAHFARSEHRPFSNVPVLKNLFEIRTPTAGDTYTVMVGKVRLREPDPFANEFAASLRAVYDLSIPESTAATVIFSTGQSGNPFSAHYRDLAQRWGSGGPGTYIDMAKPRVAGTLVLRGSR